MVGVGRLFDGVGWSEERSSDSVSHNVSAAFSAASMALGWLLNPAAEDCMEFVAIRAFWSLMRVLSRESKVVR